MRVLVIEDDADTRENLVDILQLDGHVAATAGSAREALDREDWSTYAAILLDWRLPDENAETLLPKLRERAPGAAIIVTTGTIGLSGAVTALKYGAADYLLKPIEADALRASLGRIAHQRNVEAELRLLHTAVAQLTDGVVITDAELEWPGPRILFVNPAVTRITGYPPEELLGRTPRIFQGSQSQRDELRRLRQELSAGRSYRGENVNYRKDGTHYPVELHISPVHDAAGRITNYVAIHRDITEQKQTRERLIAAERLAAIGRAMTGLAHESRNALQRSQACLEMLRRRIDDRPDVLELAQRVQVAQDDLHRLYEEVREYAAPVRVRPEPCRLRDLVEHAWNQLHLQRAHRAARLCCRDSGGATLVDVDRFAMQQVFRNILENSLDACADPVEIEVEFTADVLDGAPALRIAIRDNGPGLTPEARQRLFDEFFTTKTHGTGLGLAICKRIVEAHGGRIAADNRSGRGSQILITLPERQPWNSR